jgi:dTDP-4-amino-4,6-dideoxygalactose transaminase
MIKFLDLHKINKRFETQFQKKFQDVLDSGYYILGDEVVNFETNFATYCQTKYAVGVSNGLDALTLIFKAYITLGKLKKGDEILVPANTYIASILAILESGLKPIFVEPDIETYNLSAIELQKHITSNTKAVMAVHLYGQLANMDAINAIAKTHKLLVIEDAAQAHGAKDSNGVSAGNLSDAAGFSFYPSKNLGALGDAGAITSNNEAFINTIKMLRNYGASKKYENTIIGYNNRLDAMQAAFLNVKLPLLDEDNKKRRAIAKRYLSEIKNTKITLPYYDGSENHVFHVFVVRVKDRSNFEAYLKSHDIGTLIHYPIPPHKQEAFKAFERLHLPITEKIHRESMSIPMSPVLTNDEVTKVITIVNNY